MVIAQWGLPVNTLDGATTYTASPHFDNNRGGSSGFWAVFDEDTKSFYRVSTYNFMTGTAHLRSSPLPVEGAIHTPYVNMNKDLVYIVYGGSVNPNFMAVMKDTDNNYHYLRFSGSFVQNMWQQMNAPGINESTKFAYNPQQPTNLYYSSGSKVYAYNVPDNLVYEVLDKSPAEITAIELDTSNNHFHIASYDAATRTGTLEYYSCPVLDRINLEREYEGTNFGKIVSLIRR
jgi:hypothetical protein